MQKINYACDLKVKRLVPEKRSRHVSSFCVMRPCVACWRDSSGAFGGQMKV